MKEITDWEYVLFNWYDGNIEKLISDTINGLAKAKKRNNKALVRKIKIDIGYIREIENGL